MVNLNYNLSGLVLIALALDSQRWDICIITKNKDLTIVSASKPKVTSAVGLFSKSYGLVRNNLNVFAVLLSVSAVVTVADTISSIVDKTKNQWDWAHGLDNAFISTPDTQSLALGATVAFIVLVAATTLSLLTYIASLRAAEGKKLALKELWKDFTKNWLWLRLLGLEVVMGVLTIVGFILLIVPGVILLWKQFFATYVMIDENTTIDKAISKSWKIGKGYGWSVYSIFLLSIAFGIFSVIPAIGPIIAFLLASAYTVAGALRYVELKKINS